MVKMFFNVLATFVEFEGDLIRLRTREEMAIARARKTAGKQSTLLDKQQKELCRMHGSGECSISDLAELFSVSRPTVYRTLSRGNNGKPDLIKISKERLCTTTMKSSVTYKPTRFLR
jgi:DNA invertase Pin-like site-specific DNA recombinase